MIDQAFFIVHDQSTAEDIVQSSLISAYCKLNNGRLYAIRQLKGYLLVRGGQLLDTTLWKKDNEQIISRWLRGEPATGLEIIEKPFAWLYTIVRNNAYKFSNKQKRRQAFYMNPSHWALIEDPRCPNPEKEFIRAERNAEVREVIAALPTYYRDIVEMRYFQDQDYSFQAIAEKLHRPLATITSQSTRAHQMVRDAVEGKRIVKGGRLIRQRNPASDEQEEPQIRKSVR